MATISKATPDDVLTRHLANFVTLQVSEESAIGAAVGLPGRSTKARRDLIREGEPPQGVILILSGWACRYKMLEDGRRQILSFLLPGDMCDLHNVVLARMDHSIGAISAVRSTVLPDDVLRRLSLEYPRVGRALSCQMLVNCAMQREWTMSVGQRNALERIGSLFCELLLRLRAIGLASETAFDFPLTQIDIAEATGLTPVHVNRTVQQMRASGLIKWTNKILTIPDVAKLRQVSLFTSDYLHLDERSEDGVHRDWPQQASR